MPTIRISARAYRRLKTVARWDNMSPSATILYYVPEEYEAEANDEKRREG